ncbi:MAG: cytochrome c peroxidase [Myxococcaceae bacterium]|nr:cytochrome c peroxidase [Myxococcaceae bacterium]
MTRRHLLLSLLLVACGPEAFDRRDGDFDETALTDVTEATVPAPMQPATGPASPATVELGRLLFFDPILSGDRDIACATCHHPSLAWADARALSIGTGGTGLGQARRARGHVTTRNSMTVLNTALNGVTARDTGPDPASAPMFWDHRVRSLEAQAAQPILAADEMRGTRFTEASIFPEVEARLRATPEYVSRFSGAFGAAGISRDTITRALAAFERGLVERNSTFDRRALSAQQQRGQVAFGQHGCPACHGGPMFSDYQLHRLGVSGLTTGVRAPSLRLVAKTAPYMHDGSLPTLRAVLQFYGRVDRQLDPALRGVRGFSAQETDDVIAFLEALSDGAFDTTVPEQVPSGLPVGGR